MDRNQYRNRKTYGKLNNAGLSLVELLAAIAILGIVGGVIVGFLQSGSKTYQSVDKEVDIQYEAQVLLNQIGDYVIDANAGFKQQDREKTEGEVTKEIRTFYIYNHNGSAFDVEELSWNMTDRILSYAKKQTERGTETVLVEETLLAENVSQFSMDLSEVAEQKKIDARLELQKGEKSYAAETTWNLRNMELVTGDVDDSSQEFPDWSTVTEVVVTADRTLLRPGEEQVFYSKVLGDWPSQKVVWYLEGEPASEDTYIDEGGILHIGEDETADKLTVSARSSHDPTVSGSLAVQISDSAIRITPEDVWMGARTQDPDGYGRWEVDLSAELREEAGELSDLVWTSSNTKYAASLNEQEDPLKKTVSLLMSQSYGTVWVQGAAEDAAGNTVTSNRVNLHVVRITANTQNLVQFTSEKHTGTYVYIYGLEDVPEGQLQIAHSFEEIEKNTLGASFYLYDSKGAIHYATNIPLTKLSNGSWRCYIRFMPRFSLWDKFFPTAESEYTCLGVYKAGELNPKEDESGEIQNFGFAVSKIKLLKP